ncbi:Stp1/IreP family PP2C-type Ser/Thr phosphatase [Salimicrobium halophilum]|uniref:protein-serine/threonine phosphatase n=1 Tax=Salimicrobium halophilum TaxID=86666 RepID=A0A1G8QEA2_9BACI|nr:Stp1/IreP family PP2C-type Ser/Thr phosphatase [Salimicrobium halophilum]SDJ02903.1 protein phosphatase [Salimicrobium halophilum]
MEGFFWTDTGKVRPHNEDDGAAIEHPDGGSWLLIVADGMGGHRAGDVASRIAVERMTEAFLERETFDVPEEMETWLAEKMQDINESILSYASVNEECQGMGTTVVVAICTPSFLVIANIGDSRCYIADGSGFRQVTKDHSLVNELVRSGQISEEEADHHPRKNVLLQAVGTEKDVSPDLHSLSPEGHTRVILCSDGLTNKVSDEELSALADYNNEVETMADEWIGLANERGGEDNISIAILDYSSSPEKAGDE